MFLSNSQFKKWRIIYIHTLSKNIYSDEIIHRAYVIAHIRLELNSFSSFTSPGELYRNFLLFLPWLPCHFYLVVITTTTINCHDLWLYFFSSHFSVFFSHNFSHQRLRISQPPKSIQDQHPNLSYSHQTLCIS